MFKVFSYLQCTYCNVIQNVFHLRHTDPFVMMMMMTKTMHGMLLIAIMHTKTNQPIILQRLTYRAG